MYMIVNRLDCFEERFPLSLTPQEAEKSEECIAFSRPSGGVGRSMLTAMVELQSFATVLC